MMKVQLLINRVLKDFSDSIFYSGVIAKTNIVFAKPVFDAIILTIHNFISDGNMPFCLCLFGHTESLREFHAEAIGGLKYTCLQ